MDAQSLVLMVGEEVHGTGRLVRTTDGDWFDPPLPIRAVGYGHAGPPAPEPSTFAVPVDHADFNQVAFRYERDGCIEGRATIHGLWLGESIRIERQTTELPPSSFPTWSDPPCPPPEGGWPQGRGPDNTDFDLGDLEDTGAAVTVVIFHPSDHQAVLVVAAADVAAVEQRLRPQLRDSLCVVPSRWTRTELDAVEHHIAAMAERWQVYAWGRRCDEQAQASMSAHLVKVTNEIAQWVGSQPDGLVTIEPWLTPTRMVR